MQITYDLKDVSIVPEKISYIEHRGDVNPYTNVCGRENMLPIFVAPMASVTDENNYQTWIDNKVTPVVPRSVYYLKRLEIGHKTFVSMSLTEAEGFANNYTFRSEETPMFICIDVANGNMEKIFKIAKKLKNNFGDNIVIMSGNIANPETYRLYCEAGIDYVRIFVGTGAACTTSCAVGIHYGSASLVHDIRQIKDSLNMEGKFTTKIIADGGIKWYDGINKALVLGADYVMIGKMFAECEEACGETGWAYNEDYFKRGIIDKEKSWYYGKQTKKYRNYAGMSHRSMQKITGGDGSKVSEGIVKPVEVKYTVAHFLGNVESYLRSCMSYTNSKTLNELKDSEVVVLCGGDGVYKK